MLLVCLSKLTWKNPTVRSVLMFDGVDEVAGRVVGARDRRHVGERVDLVHHRVDALADGGVGQAGVTGRAEDDLLGVARVARARRTCSRLMASNDCVCGKLKLFE